MIINNDDFIENEFKDLNLGDKRLSKRVTKVAKRFDSDPKQSIPSMYRGNNAELKAAYRFFQNEKITDQKMLQVHYKNTTERCLDYPGKILLISDSTFVTPSKWFKDLKTHGKGKENCLRIHYVLAVSSDRSIVFGMLDFRIISDTLSKTSIALENESDIWLLVAKNSVDRIMAIDESGSLLKRCLFVTDREGDEYDLFNYLLKIKLNFTIRSQYDRNIFYNNSDGKISSFREDEILHSLPYTVDVKNKNGKIRTAEVQRSVLKGVSIHPPQRKKGQVSIDGVNIVFVREINSKEKLEDQIFWKLITTDSVYDKSESESVVNDYKARWVIEEMNKCAKSGAGAEERQFQELDHFKPFLALTYVVAWRILSIRTISDHACDTPIELIFSPEEVDYFNDISSDRDEDERIKTVKEAMDFIALEGGFTRSYEKVGWIILWRGWIKFSHYVRGHAFARRKIKKEFFI